MKTRMKLSRLWSFLFALAIGLGMLPAMSMTVHAAKTSCDGITIETIGEDSADSWNAVISSGGILSWDAQPGATSYMIKFRERDTSYLAGQISDIPSNSCNIKDFLESKKYETGHYTFEIYAVSTSTPTLGLSSVIYLDYVSALPKLPQPLNLRWDKNTAKWDAVTNATGYTVTVYSDNNWPQYVYKTTNTEYVITNLKAGYRFDVVATADGYRDSYATEGPAYVAPYTITATAGSGGTISPSGKVSAYKGEDITFTIKANTGYQVADVKVNGSSVGAYIVYTIEDVSANGTIEATFKTATYNVYFNPCGHGTIPATQTVAYGETATKPDDLTEDGWIFGGWYTDYTYTVPFDFSTPITEDTMLYAKWTYIYPVLKIAATITPPSLGETPDCAPKIVADPAGSVYCAQVHWYKCAEADFTGTDKDNWEEPEYGEVFKEGYYYSVEINLGAEEGYDITETTTGTINGKPHDDTYGELYNYDRLYGLFVPLNHAHKTTTTTTKATTKADGKKVKKCTICGEIISTTVIPKIASVKLSPTSYIYDGKVKTPTVTVKDRKGKTLVKKTDYTVTYASGRKNVGKYAVKITFKGKYRGTKTLYFNVNPKGTSVVTLSARSKGFYVKWNKQDIQTTGYQIQYSTNSKFTSPKTCTITKNGITSKTISKLSGNKRYYVRVRTYKTVKINGKSTKIYSDWSKVRNVTTKK